MKRRSQRGFTLVELSAVVVITTVLAMIAMFGYARHRGAARMTEATQLTTQIRDAQEAYKAETGVYSDVSVALTNYYPAASPGAFTTAWGDDCKVCSSLGAWRKLSVHPDAPVMYGYATIAGIGAVPIGGSSSGGSSSGGSSGVSGVPAGPTDPFYVVQAKGDVDGDGVACTVLAASNNPALTITNEGE
jgi:prepilin-type N-terminal cleavage/methylation domain-containing protein